ncbi:hypothetical protein AP071_15820 [Rhodobacter capsulatus]|nr:hypothetical protein AP071_15820 [Rhodobacter capsulatus]
MQRFERRRTHFSQTIDDIGILAGGNNRRQLRPCFTGVEVADCLQQRLSLRTQDFRRRLRMRLTVLSAGLYQCPCEGKKFFRPIGLARCQGTKFLVNVVEQLGPVNAASLLFLTVVVRNWRNCGEVLSSNAHPAEQIRQFSFDW